MFNDLGPNGNQVKAFVSRCDRLSVAETDEILRQVPAARAAYGETNVDALELGAIKQYGYNRQEKILSALGKIGPKSKDNAQFSVTAQGVTLALTFCECLTPEQFAGWYGAFAVTIPIESLPNGLAPAVAPPPKELWARFLCRLKALEPPQWGQASKVWDLVIDAVGADRIDGALDAMTQALESTGRESALGGELARAATLIDEIESLGEEYIQRLGGVYRGIGTFLGKEPGWVTGAAVNWTEWMTSFRQISRSAMIALLLQDELSAQDFAIIYAPFGGLIPTDSLTG